MKIIPYHDPRQPSEPPKNVNNAGPRAGGQLLQEISRLKQEVKLYQSAYSGASTALEEATAKNAELEGQFLHLQARYHELEGQLFHSKRMAMVSGWEVAELLDVRRRGGESEAKARELQRSLDQQTKELKTLTSKYWVAGVRNAHPAWKWNSEVINALREDNGRLPPLDGDQAKCKNFEKAFGEDLRPVKWKLQKRVPELDEVKSTIEVSNLDMKLLFRVEEDVADKHPQQRRNSDLSSTKASKTATHGPARDLQPPQRRASDMTISIPGPDEHSQARIVHPPGLGRRASHSTPSKQRPDLVHNNYPPSFSPNPWRNTRLDTDRRPNDIAKLPTPESPDIRSPNLTTHGFETGPGADAKTKRPAEDDLEAERGKRRRSFKCEPPTGPRWQGGRDSYRPRYWH